MLGTQEFLAYYPEMVAKLDKYVRSHTVDFVHEHLMRLLDHSLKGGKGWRGCICAASYFELTGHAVDSPYAEVAFTLGWALEILQGAYLIADDLMDRSQLRRGQKCWYLMPGVGDQAVNDALILENFVFVLIESLRGTGLIPDETLDAITTNVRRINVLTTVGQAYDFKSLSHTKECYSVVVKHKTSYYTFVLPFLVGIIASEKLPEKDWMPEQLLNLLFDVGDMFQAQDDYLDVYGNKSETGKVGTDISEGKVTWLSCRAFELANEQQKQELKECLGKDAERGKKLYDDLGLREEFSKYEQEGLEKLNKGVEALTCGPCSSLKALVSMLLHRKS